MNKKPDKYEINEKDIDTVLGILKRIAPDKATPEMAIALLEHFQAKFHELAHNDPKKLESMLKELETKKNLKSN